MWVEAILLGLAVGILVGMMGIGGGVLIVPALVFVLKLDQHVAQGTSLFLQLPPLGLGALYLYWKNKEVDLRAGIVCAVGILLGGYGGSLLAVLTPSRHLRGMFGLFVMLAAILVWQKSRPAKDSETLGE